MDYNITVTFAGIGLGAAMTGDAIRQALEDLPAGSRLDAAYIDGTIGTGGTDTGEQIVVKLEYLTAGNRLSATKLDDLTKTIVTGAEKALNPIGTGNVWSTAFQTAHPSANILPGDFFIASTINTATNGTVVEDGDWVIAQVANPTFAFNNPAKWYVLKISKIPTRELAFRKYNDAVSGSGIMPYDLAEYLSYALAPYSFATGLNCITTASAIGAISTGDSAVASRPGARAFASGRFAASGDAQFQESVMRLKTTNTTATEMILPGPLTIMGGKTYDFKVRMVARDAGGVTARSWEWKALISFTGNPVTSPGTIGTPIILSAGNDSLLAATLTFNNTLPQRLILTCRGLPTAVSWVAYIEALECYSADGTGGEIVIGGGSDTQIYVD
jgi:hypothetical protein